MAKIYLSSTYSDLIEHRKAVYKTLRHFGHDVVALEDYVSSDNRPIDKCFDDIDKCDIYIGIIAWRYGYIPPGDSKSVTELEFRKARLLQKTILIFMISEDAMWHPKFMDKDLGKIQLLRDELLENFVVSFFNSVDDLTSHVASSISNITEQIQKDNYRIDFNFDDSLSLKIPITNEISESLNRFKKDHEKSKKIAFIMMQFGNTKLHGKILDAIKKCLEPSNIKAVRADEKEYHDDLYYNILTYIYGCSFGIAVFERIDNDNFNPNVTLEVGHMLALGKKVCFLKDMTLPALNTDLIGKLYKTFDPQNMSNTIKHSVLKWAGDRSLL